MNTYRKSSLLMTLTLVISTVSGLVALQAAAASTGKKAGLVVGVGTHIMGSSKPIEESINAITDAGITSIRDDAPWSRVELRRGEFKIPEVWDRVVDAANKKQLSVLLILDYGNSLYDGGAKPKSGASIDAFVRYARFVVNHFKGRVARYEIWNEWDGTTGHTAIGDAEDYANLIRKVYPSVKKVDPNAQILVGAVTAQGLDRGFAERIIQLGALDYSDGLSVHTYITCRPDPKPAVWADWMKTVESDLFRHAGKEVPLYITEMGWSSFSGKCGVDEYAQAKYLTGLFTLARSLPFIRGIWWYDLRDDGADPTNKEHHFGLLHHDFTPKPAYQAMKLSTSH